MAKRKSHGANGEELHDGEDREDGHSLDESSDSEGGDIVNVDFEWFDPQPDVDFHGLKTLLKQLLGNDAQLFDLSALADLILSQPLLGSTVKVDGNESDPYAFLTVLNLREHKDKPVINALTRYIQQKSSNHASLSQLASMLKPDNPAPIGLIFTERLVNIPPDVVPPMYKMLLEEITWALEEKEPYSFSHYLIISKQYVEVESTLDQEDGRSHKKRKKLSAQSAPESFFFHPEDEVLQRTAVGFGTYEYSTQDAEGASDSRRTFQDLGIRPMGSMILIEAGRFEHTVKALEQFVTQ